MKRISVFIFSAFMLLLVAACSSTKKLNIMDAVSGKSFTVESIMGTPLNASNFTKGFPVMNFGTDGRLTGNSGCNNFNGKYVVDGEKLTLDGGAMTRMMCPGTGEQDFINALKQVNSVKADGGKLKLMNGGTEMMSLVAK